MNLLGVDYGTKKIGLAKTNTAVPVVLPFGVIENTDAGMAMQKLAQMIAEEKIDTVIAGLPFNLDGSENNNTIKIRALFKQLEQQISTPVVFVTEIFSSQAGDRMGAGVSRDEKSAMIILQGYLDKKK